MFDHIYDDYATLAATGVVEADDVTEARLVAAIGCSQQNPEKRHHDDSRLRGWIGPTGTTFGNDWDKGTLHRAFDRRRRRRRVQVFEN